MRDLRFVGLDDAGSRLLFTLDGEEVLAAEVDDPLIDATRRAHGWHSRTRKAGDGEGQDRVDTTIDELRPREIQARVRAGESPADLAAASGIDLERVERFARPVLQEREYVATAAQSVVVRTGALDGPLGEVVADRLAGVVSDAETTWDAWRREDGRWTVALHFRDDVQDRSARWSFDPSTNSVIVDDETARWLTEGTPAPPAPAPRVTETRAPRTRRLLSVPDLEPETEPAAPVAAAPVEAPAVVTTPTPAAPRADVTRADEQTTLDIPVASSTTQAPVAPTAAPESTPEPSASESAPAATSPAESSPAEPAAEAEQPAPAPARKRKSSKRASVPSWDDIVFGARKPTD